MVSSMWCRLIRTKVVWSPGESDRLSMSRVSMKTMRRRGVIIPQPQYHDDIQDKQKEKANETGRERRGRGCGQLDLNWFLFIYLQEQCLAFILKVGFSEYSTSLDDFQKGPCHLLRWSLLVAKNRKMLHAWHHPSVKLRDPVRGKEGWAQRHRVDNFNFCFFGFSNAPPAIHESSFRAAPHKPSMCI